jgi:sulfur carrier protein
MIIVNGEPRPVREEATVAALLAELGIAAAGRGVAVAVDGEVVPRARWPERALPDGCRVEVVTAMQGG